MPLKISVHNDACDFVEIFEFFVYLDRYTFKHGLACIIVNIDCPSPGSTLLGYLVDLENVKQLLQNMGFELAFEELNLTEASFIDAIRKIARREDLDKFDGLLVMILSHGSYSQIGTVDHKFIRFDRLKIFFQADHCPPLIGKPKVFLLQTVNETPDKPSLFEGIDEPPASAPASFDEDSHDFLFLTSCAPSRVAWVNPEEGVCLLIFFLSESLISVI